MNVKIIEIIDFPEKYYKIEYDDDEMSKIKNIKIDYLQILEDSIESDKYTIRNFKILHNVKCINISVPEYNYNYLVTINDNIEIKKSGISEIFYSNNKNIYAKLLKLLN
jgi:hypothetical protein